MNEELKKLLDSIKNKKQEIRELCNDKKIDDAKKAKEELKNLQEQFELLYDLEEEKKNEIETKVQNGKVKKIIDTATEKVNAFVNAIRAEGGKISLSEKDKEILNSMKEGTDEDGGFTVPQDIQTKIKEYRRTEDALENLVNVEPVSTNSGSRVIEKEAESTPFDNVEEEEEFPEENTPKLELIRYKVKKKGGILKVTQELLNDSAESIIHYLIKWIGKKAKATRNFIIIKKIREITEGREIVINNLDDLKDIFNVSLDPAIAVTSGILTNQDGYNWLDKLKDKNGNYILQPDPTDRTKKLLFGEYPIRKVNNKTLKNIEADDIKIPFICGDLKEAITIFDREKLYIESSKIAGDLWKRDLVGIKVRERLDIQTIDEKAIIMGIVIKSSTNKDSSAKTA